MDRVKRISSEILEKYQEKFGTNFDDNKKAMSSISIVRSKILRNKIAGYITSYIHKQSSENDSIIASEDEES